MRSEARYGFTTEPYSGGGRQKEFGFMSPGNCEIMQEDIMSTAQEMGKTIASLNAMVLAMQSENRALKTLDNDSLGVIGPRGWTKHVGFMGDKVDTMQSACDCQSFTNGVGTGVGIGVGIGVAAAVAYTLLSLLKKV